MSKKEEFKSEHVLKLQGKEYLPVAPRVVMFRAEHPEHSILTETREISGDTYVFAAVVNASGYTLATAHKRVRKDGKGPAALWPLETAETGAIGRALALCGYGTLSGDLDEGDQLADAPIERELQPKPVGKLPTSTRKTISSQNPTSEEWVKRLDAVKTKKEFEAEYPHALDFLDTLKRDSEEYAMVATAGVRARNRVANT